LLLIRSKMAIELSKIDLVKQETFIHDAHYDISETFVVNYFENRNLSLCSCFSIDSIAHFILLNSEHFSKQFYFITCKIIINNRLYCYL